MKIARDIIFIIIILLYMVSCNNKKTQSVVSIESVRLNNKGFEFWDEYRFNNGDLSVLDSALLYFDKAIAEDENNTAAFWNKNSVLYEQKKYDELIAILNELLENTDPNDYQSRASLNANLAQKYHLKGDSISEQNALVTAQKYFQLGLREELNEGFIYDYILYTATVSGKDTALLELKNYKDIFKDFNAYEDMKEFIITNDFNY